MKLALCNKQMELFLEICKRIGVPVSIEKTVWASTLMVFLGLLIDSKNQIVSIPIKKIEKTKTAISQILKQKKVKMHAIQKRCGLLNFLCRCMVPG